MTAQTTIPADWDVTDPRTWTLATTVDAFAGSHPSGATYRRLTEIRHEATDYEHPDDIDPATTMMSWQELAQWWADVLVPIHDAACRLAELDPDATDPIVRRVLDLPADADDRDVQRAWEDASMDLEGFAALHRRLLDALTDDA